MEYFNPTTTQDQPLTSAPTQSPEARRREILYAATQLVQQRVDWLHFFREILGVGGLARRLFPSQEEFLAFEHSEEFGEIERMILYLKEEKLNPKPNREPTRVITVRLPESIHQALRVEASDHNTSVNKLCISKLLQALNDEEPNIVSTPSSTNETATTQSESTFIRNPNPSTPVPPSGTLERPTDTPQF